MHTKAEAVEARRARNFEELKRAAPMLPWESRFFFALPPLIFSAPCFSSDNRGPQQAARTRN